MLLMLLTAVGLAWLAGVLVVVGICMSAARADRGEAEATDTVVRAPAGARPRLRLIT